MGDIIHAMVALEFLKKSIPNLQIHWIVEESFQGVLQNNPHIDAILPLNLKSIKKSPKALFTQLKLIALYKKNQYDYVIDAQGLLKSAIVTYLLGEKRIGFDKFSIREKLASLFYTQKVCIAYEANVIDRNIEVLCTSLGVHVTHNDLLHKHPFLYAKSPITLASPKPIILILGASKANKIYPKEKFLELVNLLDYPFLAIWGNKYEYEAASFLCNASSKVTMTSKLSLDALKATIHNGALVIGGDTGPTHMAWGLNIASITIFGNTPHTRNTYITPINQVIKSPSFVDANNLDKDDFSITQIRPEDISVMARSLLEH